MNTVVDEQQLSPRLGLVYDFTPNTHLHVGYARYFTPPPFELVGNAAVASFVGTTAQFPNGTGSDTPRAERSNYFDLAMVMDYWSEKRLNHHTEATTMLYGARECARLLLEEGIPQAVERHRLHGSAMVAGRGASSPSHALRVMDDGVVELRDVAGAALDRDLVVRWQGAGLYG